MLVLSTDERRQIIEIEPVHLRVTRLESSLKGKLIYRVRFGAYSGEGNTIIPTRILFEVPSSELRADMEVVDFKLNPNLPDAAFILEAPRGIRVEAI